MKLGDRVRTKKASWIFHLKHRKNRNGVITKRINSNTFLVRPFWCNWEYEAYISELEIL